MNPPPPKHRRSLLIWIIPLAAVLLLVIFAKPAVDFFHYYQATQLGDDAPTITDDLHMLRTIPGVRTGNFLRTIKFLVRGEMSPGLRVLLFVMALGGILLVAALILGYEGVLLAMGGGRRKRLRPYVWLRRVFFAVSGAGLLCILYGFYVEPNWLEVTHSRIETAKLPHGAQIRIAQISDLHMAFQPRLEPRLAGVIAGQKPDLIVFSGDAMNSPPALGRFKELMLKLSTIAPLYVVKGNVDTGAYWDSWHMYEGTNAHELVGQVETLQVRGVDVWIRGSGGPAYHSLPVHPPPPDKLSVYVYHYPDDIVDVAHDRYDLYLCGHTHGGQIALPFYGALISFSRYDKRYEAGLYHEGATVLYVNRGIGFAKWPLPQARFWSRPEVAVIDLVGQ